MRRRIFCLWLLSWLAWPLRLEAQPPTARWRIVARVAQGRTPLLDEFPATQAAGRARLAALKGQPGVVRVSLHLCPHSQGEPASVWFNCKTDSRAQYEEA